MPRTTCRQAGGEATTLFRSRSRPRARGGFSLVEVLVAIAVLTIGIIAFLEIFPNGFLALRIASNVTAADRLAQAELNQLTPGNGSEIQQVAAITRIYQDDTDGAQPGMVQLDPGFNLDRGLSPGSDLTAAQSTGFNVKSTSTLANPLNPEPYEYIGGERVSIPAPITSASGSASAASSVMLKFGPMTLPAINNAAYAYPNFGTASYNSLDPNAHYAFYVHGLPWASHPASSGLLTGAVAQGAANVVGSVAGDDPESELKFNSPEYLIDYSAGAIALRDPSSFNANGDAVDPYVQTFILQVGVIPSGGTAQQTRTFRFTVNWPGVTPGTTNAVDGYDTTLHSRWISFTSYTDSNGTADTASNPKDVLGTALNPGDTFVPGTEKLVRDFTYMAGTGAKFDNDPYEFKMPIALDSSAAIPVYQIGELDFNPLACKIVDTRGQPLQASVDYIVQDWHTIHEDKTVGEQASATNTSMANSTLHLTLTHILPAGTSDTTGIPYGGIANLGTQDSLLVYNLDTFLPIGQNAPNNYNNGYFTADYANGAVTVYGVPTGTHVRVYYHAENYWGLAVVKPAASYAIVTKANNGGTDTPPSTGVAVFDSAAGKLYFPACDTGRTVQVGGTLVYDDSQNVSHTVPMSYLIPLGAGTTATTATPPAEVDLTKAVTGGVPSGSTISEDTDPTATGASLTARAVWLQNRQWRSRDVTTVDLPDGS